MTNRILWFGDSWCAGWPGGGTPFANLTSNQLGISYKNYGKRGTSIIDMVDIFLLTKDQLTTNDIVIFCLTTSYRFTWFNEKDQKITFGTYTPSHKEKTWSVEFANDNFASFLVHHSINTLYYMCLSIGVRAFFVNNFYHLTRRNMLSPDSVWLLPPETSLAENILSLNLITPEVAKQDQKQFKVTEWQKHSDVLSKYFIENDDHPNQLGNETIANALTTILKSKL